MMTYFKRVTVDGVENGWVVKVEWIDYQTGLPDALKRVRICVYLGLEDLKEALAREFSRTDGS